MVPVTEFDGAYISGDGSQLLTMGTGPMSIGRSVRDNVSFEGRIDEVAFWQTTELSPAGIAMLEWRSDRGMPLRP